MLPNGTVRPCSLQEGMRWFGERNAERQIARTVGDGWYVSTVFLALDHFGNLFETMVFNGPYDGWMDRYKTRAEAEAGHARVVENLLTGGAPDAR